MACAFFSLINYVEREGGAVGGTFINTFTHLLFTELLSTYRVREFRDGCVWDRVAGAYCVCGTWGRAAA